MTEHVGRVLGGRYRLLSPLGSGASADVYLGDDVRLHRRVAIKVLHPALAQDEAFLRRFRAEARAAGALSHPNILEVFDWHGEDPPYLITEYLKGGSLRGMLDAGHRLSSSQALVVGLQAAQGLDVAHRQGFVHRDIKPANLLFGGDGRMRVADFGLARAVAEAAMTEPTGAVLGTARYASPEQTQGETLTGQSDIYALGLVLIEAVTGKVPFATDSTVGTLMARLDQPVEVPEEMTALQPVLERVGAVTPSDRPDAAELVSELMEAATQLPRPSSLPLVGQLALRQSSSDDSDKTVVAGAIASGAPAAPSTAEQPAISAPQALTDSPGVPGQMPVHVPPPGGSGAPGGVEAAPNGASQQVPPGVSPKRSAARKRVPSWLVPTLLTVLALAVGAVGALYLREASVPSHTVPQSLIGAQYDDLDSLIGDSGWRRDVQYHYSEDVDADHILGTDPEPGSELREGEELEVLVSCGPIPVELPENLEDVPEDDASQQLIDLGFDVEVERELHDDVDEGDVIGVVADEDTVEESCEPRDGVSEGAVSPASTVVLQVSDGPDLPEVPDVSGLTWNEAQEALEDAGFDPRRRRERDSSVARGRVTRTDPEEGTRLEEGSRVLVYVSRDGTSGGGGDDDDDDDMVEVPPLLGRNVDSAENLLENNDLELGEVHGIGGGFVYDQNPRAGQTVPEGTEVDIYT